MTWGRSILTAFVLWLAFLATLASIVAMVTLLPEWVSMVVFFVLVFIMLLVLVRTCDGLGSQPYGPEIHGVCPTHGPVSGFLSAPVYAGEPRDPKGTGQNAA